MMVNRTSAIQCCVDCDKPREACGVFGVVNNDDFDIARMVYFGLYALQHRGQESCGMAVTNQNGITGYRGMGLVSEVFDDRILDQLGGSIAVGHCRYSTAGGNSVEDIQPLMANYKGAYGHIMVICKRGNIRRTLEELR